MSKKHVIIGAAAAGIACATTLRRLSPDDQILCISDEAETPYNKCFLADVASGVRSAESAYILTQQKAEELSIDRLLGTRVTRILVREKCVVTSGGTQVPFDTLFLGVGTTPFIPQIAGIEGRGVFTFHRLSDVFSILGYIQECAVKHVIIIGGGLSGLECADSLLSQQVSITIIERNGRVLKSLVDEHGSTLIQAAAHTAGVACMFQTNVVQILRVDGRPKGVILDSGEMLAADMIICAAGLKVNTELAESAGLQMHEGSVIVDSHMQTSVASIYSGGDCVSILNTETGVRVKSSTWPDAMQQGMVAAYGMMGITKAYPSVMPVISSSFFGLKFASCGPLLGASEEHTYNSAGRYEKVLVKDDYIQGFLLIGDTKNLGVLRRALLTKQLFSSIRDFLVS